MAMVLHGDVERVGTDADGYPEYDSVREPSLVLTNSDRTARGYSASIGLAKTFENGFDFTVGYTYNDMEDVQPMTSSVAFSNYQNRAFFDPQEDVLSTSNYNIEHRFTATATWRHDFADRFPLTVSLFGMANSGRPYSFAFNGTASPYGFTPFLDDRDNVLEPGEARNFDNNATWSKIDLYANLGFRGFSEAHRASVFLNIDNLTNLLNDDWGVLTQYPFPRTVLKGTPQPRIGDASLYQIRFGIRYDF